MLWIEKYRPRTLDEIKGQSSSIKRLKEKIKKKDITHLIFKGPQGTGKTTSALVIAKVMFGDNWKMNFKELNAGDERKIQDMRGTVKTYVRYAPLVGDQKILFLDEAEALTEDSQKLLNRLMEKYGNKCKFILTCNNVEKLNETIRSRCTEYQFSPLSEEDILERLREIANIETLNISETALLNIAKKSKGDLRRAINFLQMNNTEYNELFQNF